MARDEVDYVSSDDPEPAGFGSCGRCAYMRTGPTGTCYKCARATLTPLSEHHCEVCDQTLAGADAVCRNALCNDTSRAFEWTTAIALKTGPLETAIIRHKKGYHGWGIIFARVVLGYLYANPRLTNGMGAIIPMPAYLPPKSDTTPDHAMRVIKQAAMQDERGLPFQYSPPIVEKVAQTRKMSFAASAAERREIAHELYQALRVTDPSRVAGKKIMVYDDVFTMGHSLNAVARRLREAGAETVYGLSLSRQTWRS